LKFTNLKASWLFLLHLDTLHQV